jgi:CheY-like chemotaxis protein
MTPEAAPTILVIEDYSDTRELLSSLLRQKGYEVIQAVNGKEGLLTASEKHPDLILMDLALPEMDGVEATRRIHEVPKLSQIPIFAVSAYVTEEVKADVRAAGCMAVFAKPIDFEALLKKIEETLSSRSEPPI